MTHLAVPSLLHPGEMAAVHGSLTTEIEASLKGPSLAVMLYGSQARGSAEEASDVDVLQVVSSGAGAYRIGRVAVTCYTPAHLHQMAAHGSLFILHLRTEGVTIRDPDGVLRRALDSYEPPSSYANLRGELAAAARAVAVQGDQLTHHLQAIGRLGIYLLRSWLYVSAAEDGSPNFDADLAAKSTGNHELLRVLALRRSEVLTVDDVLAVQRQVIRLFNVAAHDNSLVGLAVALSRDNAQASALVAQLVTSADALDYAGLPLPPL